MDKEALEKYKQEMMKLYGRRRSAPGSELTEAQHQSDETVEETDNRIEDIVPQEIEDVDEDAEDDTAYSVHIGEENVGDDEDFNNRYPDPDLSELVTDPDTGESEDEVPPEYFDEKSLGSAEGYILINVRTGDESSSVPGAVVAVTALISGKRAILASGLTDENGTTRRFTVPAPDTEHSQSPDASVRPYSLYDVSVTAEGFFNARSVDVPVFAGITSVQNFSMIPLPLMMRSDSETVTYFNQEPDFGGRSED